jgi:hypothetical protein
LTEGSADHQHASRRDPAPLLSKILQRLADGLLAPEDCLRTWFGPGLGLPCDGCELPITKDQFEAECEMAGGRSLRFHRECFVVWEAQRPPFRRG